MAVGITAALAMSPAAQELTYYKDVLPILQNHCQSCHRPAGQNLGGLVAPMSLMTYEEVRPWARNIVRTGLWIQKTTKGWQLVFTNEPDVWGTQYDEAARASEIPLRYGRVSTPPETFTASLERDPDRARLVMTWGSHRWTADFAVK